MSDSYTIIEPNEIRFPILVSSPHSGTAFPQDLVENFDPELIEDLDDTDWFIDTLYDFVGDMGIPMIKAHYSRWVIDLNRDPDSAPLYSDGRIITGLVPQTSFSGKPLYTTQEPGPSEITERTIKYFQPYHTRVAEILNKLKDKFGQALLFDAHSIRNYLPTIQEKPFPELILGDNDNSSASSSIIESALNVLQGSSFEFSHNHPFKGGYITRSFGKPENRIHALQLEMCKHLYMDDSQKKFDENRAEKIREVLKRLFLVLTEEMSK